MIGGLLSAVCQSLLLVGLIASTSEQQQQQQDYHLHLRQSSFRAAANKSREKTLIQRLVHRYQDFGLLGRPVMNSSDQITIEFGLAIIQILDLDENRQMLRTNCWLRYTWKDPLLNWESWLADGEFENITQVRLFPYEVWTPDIRLHNFADERLLEKRMARVVVYSDGTVLWIPQSLFKSTCPVEIQYFPFDTQVCYLEFGSWTYDITQLNLTWFGFEYEPFKYEPNPYVDFTNYIKSNEWYSDGQDEYRVRPSLRNRQIRSKIRCTNVTYQDPDGRTYNRTYKKLEYKIRMHRNPAFYLSILVLPCILLSCLTWVIFWLPPESPAKTQLGMNIFVAFFILLLLLAETTPSAVRTFPLIGYFYCLNMILITLSTFLATIVLNLYFRAERQGRLSPILRRLVVDGLGWLFLVRQSVPLPPVRCEELDSAPSHLLGSVSGTRPSRLPRLRHNKFDNSVGEAIGGVCHQRPVTIEETLSALSATPDDSPLLSRPGGPLEREVHEVKRYLRLYLGRLHDKEKRNLIAMEWRAMAMVLDRAFFTLYTLAILIAVMLLIPRSHPVALDHFDPAEMVDCQLPTLPRG